MIYPQNFEQKIGFDSIRHLLKGKCLSTLGEERVDEMAFSEKYEEINERLEQVMEFIRIIQEEDEFPDQYFFDVRPSLKRIRIEGMYLDEQELFDLRRSLETIRDIVRFLTRTTEDEEMEESTSPYPALKRLAGDIIVFPQLITRINNILDKFGKIKDNASSELLRIRRELTSTTGSISRSLNAILRNAQSEGYVDKDVTPTMRDGRLVIPVAPGLKRKIKGIVRAYGFPILFGIIFACVLVYFVRPSQIEGESMEPTLKDGQLIFCSAALKGRIEKGDIISAIISPKANVPKKYLLEDGKLNIIKRVIGAPGDTVEIRDNAVYVNHKQIEEPYLNEPMKTRDCICKLKEDEWFVMGDNRNHSLDSRAFGAVRTEEIRNLVLNGGVG